MTVEPDYYSILGVSPGSEDVVIQAAYRALMRRYHPDKNPSEAARQRTIEINAAYAVLSDATKRAAYDARRPKQDRSTKSSTNGGKAPPPPPPPPRGEKEQPGSSNFYTETAISGPKSTAAAFVVIGLIATFVTLAAVGNTSSQVANNTMNVDENLTTTDVAANDFNATDMNATIDMSATDMNATAAQSQPPDLSRLPQTAVSYDTVENAATRFVKILTTKGILGARAYSESCHKAVQTTPSWDAADGCAAFDYAAASIDAAVSAQGGFPKDGYFRFQDANQSDVYASVGAPTYVTGDRLSKIRAAAQDAATEALKVEVARMRSSKATTQAEAPVGLGNSSD